MKLTVKLIYVKEESQGVSRTSGLPWRKLLVVGEKPGSRTQRIVFNVFDNSEGFARLKRMDLNVGDIKTMEFSFGANEYNGRWYGQIDAYDCVPADENLLYNQNA